MIVMIKMVSESVFRIRDGSSFLLVYRQQLREKSQPSHMVSVLIRMMIIVQMNLI